LCPLSRVLSAVQSGNLSRAGKPVYSPDFAFEDIFYQKMPFDCNSVTQKREGACPHAPLTYQSIVNVTCTLLFLHIKNLPLPDNHFKSIFWQFHNPTAIILISGILL
jgi:hypothetical protein